MRKTLSDTHTMKNSSKTAKKTTPGNDQVIKGLSAFLASNYVFLVKLHHVHWNVTGPMFKDIHEMTQLQYQELFVGIDDIAEQVRILGGFPPASVAEFAKLTVIRDFSGKRKTAKAMVKELVADQRTLSAQAQALIDIADDADDEATEDLIISRKRVHDKNAWLLESLIV